MVPNERTDTESQSGPSGAPVHDKLAKPETTGDVGTEASRGTSDNVKP